MHYRILKHATSVALAGLLAVAVASAANAQKKYDPGATDTEIKIGNIMPYSGPASAYATIGKTEAAPTSTRSIRRRHQRPQDQLLPMMTVTTWPRLWSRHASWLRFDEVLLVFKPLGTPGNTAIQKYMNAKKVPQIFVSSAPQNDDLKGFRGRSAGNCYQVEARIYAAYILKNYPARPSACCTKRRFRQGLYTLREGLMTMPASCRILLRDLVADVDLQVADCAPTPTSSSALDAEIRSARIKKLGELK